jgi:hypothetical protein
MMIRLIPAVLLLATQVAAGQVYFDGLYGDMTSGQGVATNATVEVEGGYLSWAYSYGNLMPYLFLVDQEGVLIQEMFMGQADSIDRLTQNLVAVSDMVFIGVVSVKNHGHPIEVRGDFGMVKFGISGQAIWEQTYGLADRQEIPQRAIATTDGGFAMIGQAIHWEGSNDNGDAYLVRTDALGNVLWEQTYGGTLYDAGTDLIQTSDGGFLILGWTRSFGAGQRDFYLIKTDSLGNQQWQRTYGTAGSEGGRSILLLNDGNYLLTGSGSEGSSSTIGRKYKVNPEGGIIWSKTYAYQDNNDNNLHRTVQLPNGDLVSAGLTDRNGNNNSGWLLKTDSQGNVIWQREYDKNQFTDLFYSVLLAEDGGFLLSGQAWNEVTMSQDAWLLKVDSVGCAYPNCLVGIDELGTALAVADVWPNPATDFVNVEFLQSGMAEIQLYDMAGKLLLQRQSNQTREAVDVSSLQNGLYLLTVIQAASRTTVRVVVQH